MAHIPYFEKVMVAGPARPWITMVHGASQNRGVFSAQVDAFRQDFRLLLIDLPGHGESSEMKGPFGPEEYSTAVLAAMNCAEIDTTHFWGTHTGAGVGLSLATQHLHRFNSLILEGAVIPGVELPSIARTIGRAKTTARDKGVEAARFEWFREAEWFQVIRQKPDQCRAHEHWSLIAEFSGGPWLDSSEMKPVKPIREALGRMTKPVLLMNGEHDLADFLQVAEELASKLPSAQHAIIAGAGGFPLWEYPSAVNTCVRRFLTMHEAIA